MSRSMLIPNQRGYSLIEVLISLVILAIGLLALAGMQLMSMRTGAGSFFRSQAAVIASDFQGRLVSGLSNQAADSDPMTPDISIAYLLTDPATPPSTPTKDCGNAANTCNQLELASWTVSQWYSNANATLPSFRATITCNNAQCPVGSIITITVMWDEPDPDGVQATGTGCDPSNAADRFCYRLSVPYEN